MDEVKAKKNSIDMVNNNDEADSPLPIESNQYFFIAFIETIILLTRHPIISAKRPAGDKPFNLLGFHCIMVAISAVTILYTRDDLGIDISRYPFAFLWIFILQSLFFIFCYLLVCVFSWKAWKPVSVYRIISYSSYYLIYCINPIVSLVPIIIYCLFSVVCMKESFSISTLVGFLLLNISCALALTILINFSFPLK